MLQVPRSPATDPGEPYGFHPIALRRLLRIVPLSEKHLLHPDQLIPTDKGMRGFMETQLLIQLSCRRLRDGGIDQQHFIAILPRPIDDGLAQMLAKPISA